MGITVRQKRPGKGNSWHVFIHVGRTIQSRKIGTKRQAEAVAVELRRRLVTGQPVVAQEAKSNALPYIVDYAERFVEEYAKVACKRNTYNSYALIVRRYLKPNWSGKRLDEVTRADVKQLIRELLQSGLAPKTVDNIRLFISGLFTHAYEDEILDRNPALKLGRLIPKEDRRRKIRALGAEESRSFLAEAQSRYPDTYPLLLCAFRTGMRMGEILGLAWEDIDFAGNSIEVRRSYSHGHFDTPKSIRSCRRVDMSDQLRQTLLSHRSRLTQRFEGALPAVEVSTQRGRREIVHLAFPSGSGGPMDGSNLRNHIFYKLIEELDIPRFRFHDIRHTFASLLLQNGESLHYVKEQMGHASIQTTVDVYGHLVPGSNRNAVNRLDDEPAGRIRIVSDVVA